MVGFEGFGWVCCRHCSRISDNYGLADAGLCKLAAHRKDGVRSRDDFHALLKWATQFKSPI